MPTFPQSIETLNAAMLPMAAGLKKLGVTNVQLASNRSVRFDLPNIKDKDGRTINRVKLTAHPDGTVDVRLMELVEHDLIGGVPTDKVGATLKTFLGLDL